MEFLIGTKVNFQRDPILKEKGTVVAFNNALEGYHKEKVIIIESKYGWSPDDNRIRLFGLEKDKKYLFVEEYELRRA